MNFAFSTKYVPPAPVLRVSLAVPDETPAIGPQLALIDTGADGTFIPIALLEKLDTPIVYATNVRSHLGEKLRRVSVYQIDILIDQIRLPGVDVVGDDWSNEIILGRNMLNKLSLLIDGPQQVTRLK